MIEKIKLSIDNLVKHGEIKKGESIKVKNCLEINLGN